MLLSVVVIGRNEGLRLLHCLASIAEMSYPKEQYEVIYVDSESTDDSVQIALSRGVNVLRFFSPRLSAAAARNFGLKSAKGSYILFLDADCMIAPKFVEKALSFFDSPEIAIVSGELQELDPDSNIYKKVFGLDWDISDRNFCGGNALVRRSVLEEIGGYDDSLIAGEEPEMCQRLQASGYRVKHIPELMAIHDLNIQAFSQYWRRCFRSGYAYASVSSSHQSRQTAFWAWESRHNLLKGFLMIFGFFLTSFLLPYSFFPFLFYWAILVFLIFKTAWHVHQKHDWKTSVLYAIHAHFQHIPMFFGQIHFFLHSGKKL